jgi:hypothetical protein
MRTIRTKVYRFKELVPKSQAIAIEQWRQTNYANGNPWANENYDTLKAFCKVFPCSIGRNGLVVTSDHSELSGQRLAKYIWNNYRSEIYKAKQYWICNGRPNTVGANSKHRDSKIFLIEDGCPLTGFYMDNEILKPLFDFMRKPDARETFEDLLQTCYYEWERACERDWEWQNEDAQIIETIEANAYEFTENGKMI